MICVKNIILILSLRLNLIFFFVDIVCIIYMDYGKKKFYLVNLDVFVYMCVKNLILMYYIFVLGVFVIML